MSELFKKNINIIKQNNIVLYFTVQYHIALHNSLTPLVRLLLRREYMELGDDNDNELCIQTKSNEKHHKGNINNTYKNTNNTTFVPRRLHLKTSWPLAYNYHL